MKKIYEDFFSQVSAGSVRKVVFRNFEKFTGKQLCESIFFNKVAHVVCNFIKKETLAQIFSG